ncbi:hypothetical protein BGI15_06945 [Snodgrassella alvi]|nr:hypothetical protein BGI07_05110 [Snodgrassella alvi]ORF29720.1 hypothetical protein BGI10_09810 [Snodgrassella alvi]ORF32646.1 hypothetical protein BGI11_10535 [Snodgrassella alvi]ORF40347.1 hypothetical protein BGI13_01780 [Snodgrassella alvi]ORF41163.1 hypothetical protein BGI14_03270 [Snodgrassella alvi]
MAIWFVIIAQYYLNWLFDNLVLFFLFTSSLFHLKLSCWINILIAIAKNILFIDLNNFLILDIYSTHSSYAALAH